MMKVLLVDDETPVLNHLKSGIPWKQLGLQVCGCLSNGAEAFAYMKEHPVDILITDIRMPGMDGLELCRRVRENNQAVQLILLTGYADFNYAKQAIGLQVTEYCLKPVDIPQLTELLRKTVRRGYSGRGSSHADALLDLMESGSEEELRAAFAGLGIEEDAVYLAGSVGVHNIEKALGASFSCKVGKHKYLYFSGSPMREDAAARIITYARGRSGIGMPAGPFLLSQLNAAVDDVLVMTLQYFINGAPTLCTRLTDNLLAEELQGQLEEKSRDPRQLKPWLHQLAQTNCSLIFNMRTAYRFLNQAALHDIGGEAFLYGFEQLAADYLSLSGCLETLSLAVPLREPAQPAQEAGAGAFLSILSYLNAYYSQDISLKKISEEFHLNPSYISQLIKGETGLTYTQYVTELRIGKAKELLKTTRMSLTEISDAVGFNDYFYFIKKFKKVVGVTPGKFE